MPAYQLDQIEPKYQYKSHHTLYSTPFSGRRVDRSTSSWKTPRHTIMKTSVIVVIVFMILFGPLGLYTLTLLIACCAGCCTGCFPSWPECLKCRRRARTTESDDVELTAARDGGDSAGMFPDLAFPAASHQWDRDSQETLWDPRQTRSRC